jgi:acyl-coenzyme A synthetase/AMP-(fatty) acid ligase/acyl carrier protein
VYPDEVTRDPVRLFGRAAADGVAALEVTVSQLDQLVRSGADGGQEVSPLLPTVLVAGEKLRAASVEAFHRLHPDTPVINAYGQTECTGMTLARTLDRHWQPPLDEGVASRNNVVLVCDPRGHPLPPGFVGELYVSGDGLALGYWTGERLDQTGFEDHSAMGRTYRTGDLGRSRSSGTIEVLGRLDGQVKLRGVRIEPGEVEEALCAIPAIAACAVVARPYPLEAVALVAYLQIDQGANLDDAAIRASLRVSLPEIMIPAVFCRLDNLPLSPNGKVDRRSLPDPHLYAPAPTGAGDRSLNEVEQTVLRLWRSALEMPSLEADHNFFAAGGTSLQAVVLISEMAAVFGIELSLDTIFRCPSARELAAVIAQLRVEAEP